MSTELDLMAVAPMAVFVLAALFATLAALKRRAVIDYLRRMRLA